MHEWWDLQFNDDSIRQFYLLWKKYVENDLNSGFYVVHTTSYNTFVYLAWLIKIAKRCWLGVACNIKPNQNNCLYFYTRSQNWISQWQIASAALFQLLSYIYVWTWNILTYGWQSTLLFMFVYPKSSPGCMNYM